MTEEDLAACGCVIDCSGLHEITAIKSNNLQKLFIDRLSSGEIAVPAVVWKEFKELYDEEAKKLEPYVTKKIIMKREGTSF
jgi:hypothetical protein